MTWQSRNGVQVWTGALAPDDTKHGTLPGYRAHRRGNETPCLQCLDAWNRDQKRRFDARKHPCPECDTPTSGALCRRCANVALINGRWAQVNAAKSRNAEGTAPRPRSVSLRAARLQPSQRRARPPEREPGTASTLRRSDGAAGGGQAGRSRDRLGPVAAQASRANVGGRHADGDASGVLAALQLVDVRVDVGHGLFVSGAVRHDVKIAIRNDVRQAQSGSASPLLLAAGWVVLWVAVVVWAVIAR